MPHPANPSLSPAALLDLLERTRNEPDAVVREAGALLPGARAAGDRRTLTALLTALGAGLLKTGEHAPARATFDEALILAAGDPDGEAPVLAERLALSMALGDTTTARGDTERLTAIVDILTEPRVRTRAMNSLAGIAYRQGRLDDAGGWLARASRTAIDAGDRAGASIAATNAAFISIERGNFGEAFKQMRQALGLADSPQAAATLQTQHAVLYGGLRLYGQMLTVTEQYLHGRPLSPPSEADKGMLLNHAEALTGLGRLTDAAGILEHHALQFDGGLRISGNANDTLGKIYGQLGRTAEARTLLTRSRDAFLRAELPLDAARTLLNRAELELPHDPPLVLECVREALDLLGPKPPERLQAQALWLQAQAHAALGEYREAYGLGERHRALQDELDRRLERQRMDVALAELEYERAQVMARLQQEALREARQEVAELHAHLEERVAQRTGELQAVNEELRAFAHSVSHYLRTPMQVILGHALLLESVNAEQQARSAGAIVDATERMAGVLDGLLGYASRGTGLLVVQDVDLVEVVRAAWQDQADPAGGAALVVGALPAVLGDPSALRVVFGNLLHNAVKFTRVGVPSRVEVSARTGPGVVVVEVRDNGVGFDPVDGTQVFGAFTRLPTTTQFEGLGLGLADVWRIVIAHGGHVRAEGRPGVGASFFVTLPAAGD